MYLVKRSPYPFIQVYPFIKDQYVRIGTLNRVMIEYETESIFSLVTV